MDAVTFLQERLRMLKSGAYVPSLDDTTEQNISDVVNVIETWSENNPIRTRQSVFLEQWPNAEIDCQGVIAIDPCNLDKTMHGPSGNCYPGDCDKCRLDFWTKEVEKND